MKDELGFNDVKRNWEYSKQNPNKKQVYLPYEIELLSILKDAVIITDKNFIICLNKRIIEFSDVDMNNVLCMAKNNLEILIRENDAFITSDKLPVVKADEVQMVHLLQNFITNSIKFKGKKPPYIHITAEKLDSKWLFSFEDNGIGIKPEYRERIFKIFQRLHGPEKYDGTGIGLAISKRIVERHGGTICVDSKADERY